MRPERLGTFSDAVIAIVMTVMVLELGTPDGSTWHALHALVPTGLTYVLSFVSLGIYWNNHHHLFQTARQIDGRVLWANLLLLFFLSLFPVSTKWMGATHFARTPVVVYGIVLILAASAYYLLSRAVIGAEGPGSALAAAIGRDRKGLVSLVVYAAGIGLAYLDRWIGVGAYVAVALIWFVPDRRLERGRRAEARSV